MIKHIMLALVLVVGLSGLGNAESDLSYTVDGVGTFSDSGDAHDAVNHQYNSIIYRNDAGKTLYMSWHGTLTLCSASCWGSARMQAYCPATTGFILGGTSYYNSLEDGDDHNLWANGYSWPTQSKTITSGQVHAIHMVSWTGYDRTIIITVSETPIYEHTISGSTDCLDEVKIYRKINSNYIFEELDLLDDDSYTFDILNQSEYKLIFDEDHEYIFTCNNSSITYNYDDCTHTKYRFEESCGNLIPDSEGLYIENYGLFGDTIKDFYAPNGILDIANTSADFMYVYTDTFIGKTGWIIDPVEDGYTYTLENPIIDWGLKVIVVNESDGELIDDAMVKVDQICYCTAGYSTRQKMTVNGMVEYDDMSLQDASLMVMATGYKILNENTTGYSAFLSGRTNFSSKTWIVKMAPTWSNNTSSFYEPQYKVDIHFKNEDGNRTSQILDTDTEVYLYYENNNSKEEAMTLKFQSSSTHSHFIDEDSWTIAYDTIGHKTIPNVDFTPWTCAYRAIIYNSSVYGWNITIPLTVRNETKEETLHYENLTTNLWFRHEADGKIDYREDMQIVSHARSNNTTLMTIDLEIWKDGALLCYTNLTKTDYAGADFPYYYVYEPVHDYVAGSNYTAKMYGFDRTLLEVRYLEVINDTITRKNKLTIGVKDRFGANLDNCYIYLEGWGSLPTGTTYYNAYEGIGNGDYRYKATKSGYTDSGWSDVTLTDDDQIVWYTLSQDTGNLSVSTQKFTDEDIKGFFFPLMYFLLICIILGGLKYVTQ